MSAEEPSAWERRENETDPAWAAFVAYRDAGPQRSTAKTGRLLGKSKKLMDGWSSKHSWVERTRAYDMHLDDVGRKAHADEITKMRKRHARIGMRMQGVGIGALDQFESKDKKTGKTTFARISASEASRLAKEGVQIERISRGEPESIHENRETDVDSALEREAQRLLDDPGTRRRLAHAGSGTRSDESDASGNGGDALPGEVESD